MCLCVRDEALTASMRTVVIIAAQIAKYAFDVFVKGAKKVSTKVAGVHHKARTTAKNCWADHFTLGASQLLKHDAFFLPKKRKMQQKMREKRPTQIAYEAGPPA